MHILSISPSFSNTGVTRHVENLNKGLLDDGHKVTSIPLSTTRPVIEQQFGQETVTHRFPVADGDWFEQKLRLIDIAIDTFHKNNLGPVDLIHSHDWLAGKAGTILSEKLRCPHIATIHTLTELQRQSVGLPGILPAHAGQIKLEKALCSSPDALIAVSQDMMKTIHSVAVEPVPPVEVIPNGIAVTSDETPNSLENNVLRQKLAPERGPIILFVGRLAPQKGVEFLLASSFAVRNSKPNARWIIIGDHIASHMTRPVYERVLNEGGSRDHIQFLGEIPHHDIESYYRAADCLIVPSLFEGCPYVVLEAMQARVPIIASDLPCFREILADRETALLAPCDKHASTQGPDVNRLAQAQLEILDNPGFANRLTLAAAQTVRDHYPLEQQLEHTFAAYQKLINKKADKADDRQLANCVSREKTEPETAFDQEQSPVFS